MLMKKSWVFDNLWEKLDEGIIAEQLDPDKYQSILIMLDNIKRNGLCDIKSKHVCLCERERESLKPWT